MPSDHSSARAVQPWCDRQPRRLLGAALPVAVVFLIWDAIAVAADVWWYNPRYIHLAGLPDPGRRLVDQTQCAHCPLHEQHTTGVRFPFDIRIEDFLFGFALVTAVLLLWERRRPQIEMADQR